MSIWLISLNGIFILLQTFPIFAHLPEVKVDSMRLNKLVRFYEVTSLQRLSPLSRSSSNNNSSESILTFRAFGKTFYLNISPSPLPEATVKIYGKHGPFIESTKTTAFNSSLYYGIVNGDPHSLVEGFFLEIGFHCTVNYKNDTYRLEPAALYFTNIGNGNSTIVYRPKDIRKCGTRSNSSVGCGVFSDSLKFNVLRKDSEVAENHLPEGSGASSVTHGKRSQKIGRNRCEIELVADPTLVSQLNRNVKDVITLLYYHAKQADQVFRKADFDLNGSPDGVRIVPTQIVIYYDDGAQNYPLVDATSNDATDFLLSFSRRTQRFCLSVCFTSRIFRKNIVGMAYRASSVRKKVGGICQRPTIFRDGTRMTTNTAIVSFRTHEGKLSTFITVHALIHELGHSFGSEHDPLVDKICSPGGHLGNYIMHPYTIDGTLQHHKMFSPCSSKAIAKAINVRGDCLEAERIPTCGNGAREEGEECDCGNQFTCNKIDPCCTPKGGLGTDKECTLRRNSNAECSYIESPCCTATCQIVPVSENRVCGGNLELCFVSVCNGVSSECPVGHVLKDGTPCRGTFLTCKNGVCSSSVCLDKGLEACECKDENQCHVCCFSRGSNSCIAAMYLGFMVSEQKPFLKLVGTPCCRGKGTCDRNGYCQLKESRSTTFLIISWSATITVVALIAFAMALVMYYLLQCCARRFSSRRKTIIYSQAIKNEASDGVDFHGRIA